MAVFVGGRRPNFTGVSEVVEGEVFLKGEYGLIKNHKFIVPMYQVDTKYINLGGFVGEYKRKLGLHDAKVLFLKVREEQIYGEDLTSSYIEFTVEECYFKGSPIAVTTIIGLSIVLAGVVLVFYRPLIFKLSNVTPEEVKRYREADKPTVEDLIQNVGVIGIVAVVLVIGLLAVFTDVL